MFQKSEYDSTSYLNAQMFVVSNEELHNIFKRIKSKEVGLKVDINTVLNTLMVTIFEMGSSDETAIVYNPHDVKICWRDEVENIISSIYHHASYYGKEIQLGVSDKDTKIRSGLQDSEIADVFMKCVGGYVMDVGVSLVDGNVITAGKETIFLTTSQRLEFSTKKDSYSGHGGLSNTKLFDGLPNVFNSLCGEEDLTSNARKFTDSMIWLHTKMKKDELIQGKVQKELKEKN